MFESIFEESHIVGRSDPFEGISWREHNNNFQYSITKYFEDKTWFVSQFQMTPFTYNTNTLPNNWSWITKN